MLTVLDRLPPGLLEAAPAQLHAALAGPALIHLPGRRHEPLFVAALLHGNETTGWLALRALLQKYVGRTLPRALSIFIGNVAAARTGARRLPAQPDYNRVWAGDGTPEHVMARQVLDAMRTRGVFASIDLHNNTGRNPHYAIVNRLGHAFFQLATLFQRTVIYSRTPDTTLTHAFSALCPAVTLECGLPGGAHGTAHALDYLEACLHLAHVPATPVHAHDMDLFHSVAVVRVPDGVRVGFGATDADIQFAADLDRLNFRELAAGVCVARVRPRSGARLEVLNEHGVEVHADYFVIEDDEIRVAVPVMPAMLTTQADIVRLDCLCYLMQRFDWHAAPRDG